MKGTQIMRSISSLSFFALAVLLGQANTLVSAQETNPPGSYQQTCSDISVRKGNLYAKCQDANGKAHASKLANYEKGSEIANKNGHLECAGSAEGGTPSQPRGSYTETCRDIHMKGAT